ncbi:hypothetical protein FRC02_005335 [Tulasnella sp. 418]|nr:hypothetical protein FRC02_005335 [Tulasnella sp. 418]
MRSFSLLCSLVVSNGLLGYATPVSSGLTLQRRNGCDVFRKEVTIEGKTYSNLNLLIESEDYCVYTVDKVVARLRRRAMASHAHELHVAGLIKTRTLLSYGTDTAGDIWSIQAVPFSGGTLPYKHQNAAKAFMHDENWRGEYLNPSHQRIPLSKPQALEEEMYWDCVKFLGHVRGLIATANKQLEQRKIYLRDTDIDDWLINPDMTKAVNIYLGDWSKSSQVPFGTPEQEADTGLNRLRAKWHPDDIEPYAGVCRSEFALEGMETQKWHDLVNIAQDRYMHRKAPPSTFWRYKSQ